MSWYDDDPEVDSLFGELAENKDSIESEPLEVVEELEVGDVVGGLYRVESIEAPGRARVKLIGVECYFELRQVPEIFPLNDHARSRAWEELDFVVSTAGFLTSDNLGYITDYGYCEGCGGFVVCEWVDGDSLADFMTAGTQFDLDEAIKFVLEIGGALVVMHEVGLSHGLRDARDMVRDTHGRWRLLAPGLRPSRAFELTYPIPVAPEIKGSWASTQKGDIFALAASLYGLLISEFPEGESPFGPSDLRADIPELLDIAILRALSVDPGDRHAAVEEFQAELVESVRIWHEPSVAGFDAREASRLLKPLQEQGAWTREVPSVVVRVDLAASATPKLFMEFANVGRLRREYRRNILAGGLFVPTPQELQRNQEVDVELVFGPTARSVTIKAQVAQVAAGGPEQPAGVGVIFDAAAKVLVLDFLRICDPVLGLAPNEKIMALRMLDKDAEVDAAEAFLLSRLSTPMELGALRAVFQGLPFDFEEALGGLLQKNYARALSNSPATTGAIVEPARAAPRPRIESRPVTQEPPRVKPKTPVSAVDRAMEQAEYQESRGNFRAAIDILEVARSATPDIAIYLKLVRLYATFQKNWGKAGELLREITRIAPNNQDVVSLQAWLTAQEEEEQARKLYSVNIEGAKVRFLLVHPESRKLWFELTLGGASPRREIHEVDYVRSKGSLVRRAAEPIRMSAIPANPVDFAAIQAVRDNIPHTVVGRRHRLLNRAQSSMNDGPWFRTGPIPSNTTENSKFLVFERNPKIMEDGLFIVHEGKDIAPLRLDPDGTRGKSPVLCPDESGGVAWVRTSPTFGVYIAEPFQAARLVLELPGDASLVWLDAKTLICVSHANGEVYEIPRRGDAHKVIRKLNATQKKFWVDTERVTGATLDTQNQVVWFDLKSGEIKGKCALKSAPEAGLLRSDGFLALRYPTETLIVRIGRDFSKKLPLVADLSGFCPANHWKFGHPLLLICSRSNGADVYSVDPKKIMD